MRATEHKDDEITTLNHDAEIEQDSKDGGASDSEKSLKTEDSDSDSFGADGAWGEDNDETSDGACGASLALNFVT
jgi:hypothetical protein